MTSDLANLKNKISSITLSKKQLEFFKSKLGRFTLLHGSISSGKTYIANLKIALTMLANIHKFKEIAFYGRTKNSVVTNICRPLQKFLGEKLFTYSQNNESAYFMGKKIDIKGGGDIKSEGSIRGNTADLIYIDEATLLHPSFIARAFANARAENSTLIATTNPDSPSNFVYKTLIENKDSKCKLWHFTMEDNETLDIGYKKMMDVMYLGGMHDRFVKGLWVSSDASIYLNFITYKKELIKKYKKPLVDRGYYIIGVDFGGNPEKSSHVFTLTYISENYDYIHVVKTLKFSFKKDSTLGYDALELADKFLDFIKDCLRDYDRIMVVRCDSSEVILINTLRNALLKEKIDIPVAPAVKKQVYERCRFAENMFAYRKLFIDPSCVNLIKAFEGCQKNPNHDFFDNRYNSYRLDDGTSDVDSLDSFDYTIEIYIQNFVRFWSVENYNKGVI